MDDEERLLEGDTRNYRKKIIVESEDINLDIQTIDNNFMEEVFELTHENPENIIMSYEKNIVY